MTEYIWVKHPETEAVTQIPEEALPMLRQSGWDALSDEEIAEREQVVVDEAAAAEEAMREQAEEALNAGLVAPSLDDVAVAEEAMREQAEVALNAPAPPPPSRAEQTGPTRDESQTEENV